MLLLITRSLLLIVLVQFSLSYVFKSKFNKLRYLTLKDDAFCEAYQEFKDNNCVAKLTFCSQLNDDQLLKMRQLLCGPKFNAEIQPPPHIHQPPEVDNKTEPFFITPDYPPPYFLDIHPAQPNSFPWLAAIYNPARQFMCSGALVAPKTVVTSAQCVSSTQGEGGNPAAEQNSNFFVRFGRHHLNLSSPYDKAYEYDVESIEISQQFDKNTLENDFAILKLVSPVCKFPPIELPKKDDWENGHYFGNKAPVVYSGWGLGQFQAPYLRSLTSHLIPKDICAKKFNWPHEQLSSNHLCVSPPINVCVGGIGTPLVAYTPHRCVLLGLMSFGDHCNTPKVPLIFTKVSTFIDEIYRFVEEDFKSINETSFEFEECFHHPKSNFKQPYYYYPSHYKNSYHQHGHDYHEEEDHGVDNHKEVHQPIVDLNFAVKTPHVVLPHYGVAHHAGVPHHGISHQAVIPHHGIAHQAVIPHHGIAHQAVIPHHGIAHQAVIPHYGIAHQAVIPHHGIAHQAVIPHHGIAHQAVIPHHGIAHQAVIPHHGIAHQAVIPHHGIAHQEVVPHHGIAHQEVVPQYGVAHKQEVDPHYGGYGHGGGYAESKHYSSKA